MWIFPDVDESQNLKKWKHQKNINNKINFTDKRQNHKHCKEMMLQLDPAELLRETLEGCDIETDLDTIDRIAENLKQLQDERNQNIITEQQELQGKYTTSQFMHNN